MTTVVPFLIKCLIYNAKYLDAVDLLWANSEPKNEQYLQAIHAHSAQEQLLKLRENYVYNFLLLLSLVYCLLPQS